LVVYEMARRLELEGDHVELLALIDSLNPAWRRSQDLKAVAAAMLRQWSRKAAYHRGMLGHMDAGEAVRYMAGRMGAFVENYAETMGAWLLRGGILLPWQAGRMKRANRRAMLTYTPGEYGGRVLLIKVRGRRLDAPLLGWKKTARGDVQEVEMPLHPYGALAEGNVQRLAAILRQQVR
jgi:thioesterase domain-containing protein